jgi:uncharacterized phage protein (TIGR01671 family)
MREYKFRAWDEEIRQIVYPHKIDFNLGYAYYFDSNEEIQRCETSTLMQSTGLQDKNGVEIYEGDIIKYNLSFPVGEIVFNRDRFTPIYDRSSYDEWELDFWRISDKCEVIGNIY